MSKHPPTSGPGVAGSIGALLPKGAVSDPQLGGRFLACLKIHRQAGQALREASERFFQSEPSAIRSLAEGFWHVENSTDKGAGRGGKHGNASSKASRQRSAAWR